VLGTLPIVYTFLLFISLLFILLSFFIIFYYFTWNAKQLRRRAGLSAIAEFLGCMK